MFHSLRSAEYTRAYAKFNVLGHVPTSRGAAQPESHQEAGKKAVGSQQEANPSSSAEGRSTGATGTSKPASFARGGASPGKRRQPAVLLAGATASGAEAALTPGGGGNPQGPNQGKDPNAGTEAGSGRDDGVNCVASAGKSGIDEPHAAGELGTTFAAEDGDGSPGSEGRGSQAVVQPEAASARSREPLDLVVGEESEESDSDDDYDSQES